jgi:hypothetical protein
MATAAGNQLQLFKCKCGAGVEMLLPMCPSCYRELGRDLDAYGKFIAEIGGEDDVEQ